MASTDDNPSTENTSSEAPKRTPASVGPGGEGSSGSPGGGKDGVGRVDEYDGKYSQKSGTDHPKELDSYPHSDTPTPWKNLSGQGSSNG